MTNDFIMVPDEVWEMKLKPKEAITYVFYLGSHQGFNLDLKRYISDSVKKRCTVELQNLGMIDDLCIPVDPKNWKRPQKAME